MHAQPFSGFLPSDFFVRLSGCCWPPVAKAATKARSRSPTPPAQGHSALSEFLPLRSLRWPRLLPRLRLPGSLLCLPAAAGFPWQFRFTPDPRATIKLPPTLAPRLPRDEDEPEVAKAAASRCRSRSPAVRVAAERRWLRPPNPLRLPAVAPAAAPHTLGRQALS